MAGEVDVMDYVNVEDWLIDNYDEQTFERVVGAKIVGMHEVDDLESDDPRFNGHHDDCAVVLRDKRDDKIFLLLDINLPEAALLRHAQALRAEKASR